MFKKTIILVALLTLVRLAAFSQDRIFNYVYQSLVLSKGEKELEVWTTYRTGKEEYFRRLDTRAEFEIGLGKKVQTSFYLNYSSTAEGGMEDTLVVLNHENEFSFSNEWKYKISDPVANAIGSALIGEITVGTTEIEMEAKVILDKKIGRVTQALNLVFEPEWSWKSSAGEITSSAEYKFEFNYGLGVFLGKGFTLGAEIRNPNMIENNEWGNSALYAGPTLSYFSESFWVNLSFMPQVAGLRGISPGQGLNLGEYERYQARILFSYTF